MRNSVRLRKMQSAKLGIFSHPLKCGGDGKWKLCDRPLRTDGIGPKEGERPVPLNHEVVPELLAA